MDCCIWLAIAGHQKCSHNKDKVWSWPWWPASLWHPFTVVTWCALGTTKSRRSSILPLGIEQRYRAPWWIMKFCQFSKMSWPSLLEVCSARSVFKSVFFCAFSQSKTVLNVGSSSHGYSPISNMHFYQCIACGNMYLSLKGMVTLNHGRVMNFSPMHCS